jgi:methylase of polypeptide subunit release factors
MSALNTERPFRLNRCSELPSLRDALQAVSYTQENLAETIDIGRAKLPLLLRRTAASSRYNTLVRLFRLGHPVPVEAACVALKPLELDDLMASGLLICGAGGIKSAVAISPVDDSIYLAHDFEVNLTGSAISPEAVLGAGPAARTLAAMTVRRHDQRVLDLCCGGGIQALLAAQHAVQVTATDINCRAGSFVALNARLNGLTNVEFREGSLYDPVKREQFDLVVANPPYVISPETSYAYRDSGLPGDMISEQVIRYAPYYLKEGGFCSVIFNWHHGTTDDNDERWADRPRRWVQENGCDTWLLRFGMEDPLSYAVSWLVPEERTRPAEYETLLDQWLTYYQRNGIGAISMGVLVMRKRTAGSNWVRVDSPSREWNKEHCGEQIQRIFEGEDLLEQADRDNSLLERRLMLVNDHELSQTMRASDGSWTIDSAVLRQKNGFGFSGHVDSNVMMLLAGCDGRRTLGEALAKIAHYFGTESNQVVPNALRVVRNLIRSGFLVEVGSLKSSVEN